MKRTITRSKLTNIPDKIYKRSNFEIKLSVYSETYKQEIKQYLHASIITRNGAPELAIDVTSKALLLIELIDAIKPLNEELFYYGHHVTKEQRLEILEIVKKAKEEHQNDCQ